MEAHERIVNLRAKNDGYHDAVEDIMQCDELEVLVPEGIDATEVKANFMAQVQRVFEAMKRAEAVIAEYYDPQESEPPSEEP